MQQLINYMSQGLLDQAKELILGGQVLLFLTTVTLLFLSTFPWPEMTPSLTWSPNCKFID